MEQKTFLAIVLSFLFLMTYNAFVIVPQQKAKTITESKIVENINHKSKDTSQLHTESPNSEDAIESYQDIKIGSFKIRFTTNKGIIKEISSEKLHYSPFLSDFLGTSPASILKSYSHDENTVSLYYEDADLQIRKQIKAIDDNKLTFRIEYLNTSNLSKLNNVQFKIFDIDLKNLLFISL